MMLIKPLKRCHQTHMQYDIEARPLDWLPIVGVFRPGNELSYPQHWHIVPCEVVSII